MQAHPPEQRSSVSEQEIARFGRLAASWWDTSGPMRPLHQMNPLRVGWTDSRLARLRDRHPGRALRLLDIGCGAGLASEALAALGHDVLGVDAAAPVIEAARAHAALHPPLRAQGGSLRYAVSSAESLQAQGERFDAITALEVIEHVDDPARFLHLLAALLEPGGVIVISTLNRTWRSLATAKIGAEYVLRLLPVGTHDWSRFVTPAELTRHAGAAGLRLTDIAGMVPTLSGVPGRWRESRDLAVNYIAAFTSDYPGSLHSGPMAPR